MNPERREKASASGVGDPRRSGWQSRDYCGVRREDTPLPRQPRKVRLRDEPYMAAWLEMNGRKRVERDAAMRQ